MILAVDGTEKRETPEMRKKIVSRDVLSKLWRDRGGHESVSKTSAQGSRCNTI